MQVQVNHDNHTRIASDTSVRLTRSIEDALSQFAERITRVEMHLADDNAGKGGSDDKRCVLEVRLEHRKPMAVTAQASSLQYAIDSALEKMTHALDRVFGKLGTLESCGDHRGVRRFRRHWTLAVGP